MALKATKGMGGQKKDSVDNDHAVKRAEFHRPAFGYYGAKVRLAQKIVSMLPPHNAWVEAFCGSAAVTLAKAPAPIEVINDTDGEIVNLFRQLRRDPDELCRLVALTPYAREEFRLARNSQSKHLSAMERARRFLVAAMMTVNGTSGSKHSGFSFSNSYTRSGKEARVSRWYNLPARIELVVERLRSVRVESLDALELIEDYLDRPASLLYLDPPYFTDREHGYKTDAREEVFHSQLLKLVRESDCMLLISGYDSELYRDLLDGKRGWKAVEVQVKTRATSGKDFARTEIFWMNKRFADAKNGRVAIALTKTEENQQKVNPRRSGRNLAAKVVKRSSRC
jgi:DNA adenine methylase